MENEKSNYKAGYQLVKTESDKELLITTIILVVVGLLAVVSASMPLCISRKLPPFYYVNQHLFWIFCGSVGMWICSRLDFNSLKKITLGFTFAVIILLLIVKFTPLGVTINGARRWLDIGFIRFQPSEFTKPAIIMLMGSLLSMKKEFLLQNLPKYLLTAGVMVFIVLKQPNLSMTLILLGTAFCMYLCSGKTLKYVYIGLALLICIFGMIMTGIIDLSNFIEPYQWERLFNWIKAIFTGKSFDIQNGGYQVFHSLIAISSGGFLGCGYGGGKEKLGWLPESHTDFIFSVISEEIGFIGSLFIILLFMTLLYRGINIALKCPSKYGQLLAIGITLSITIQAFFNISVAISLLPATGITLPFISYGGSSLLVSMSMTGVLLNISKTRMVRSISPDTSINNRL